MKRHEARHRLLANVGHLLFAVTFAAALLHSMRLGSHRLHNLLALAAIVFPAVGGAVGALRTQG